MAKVHRTYWIVRQRYRQAGYLGSVVTVLLAFAYLVPSVHGADPVPATGGIFDVPGTIAMLLLAAAAPLLIGRLCWRLHRRRYFADIYHLGIV
jgi:hypothetical protein